MNRSLVIGLTFATVAAAGCTDNSGPAITAPTGLTYEVEASGDPGAPSGVLLTWDAVSDAGLSVYRVYSRGDQTSAFDLRGSTTSTSFHDIGQPDLEYYVTAVNTSNRESEASNTVLIDERLALDAPASLTTTSLNGAIYLGWSDNSFQAAPDGFKQYRVYSAPYNLDQDQCGTWALEGTTVSPEFVAGALTNGVPRCFGISAESVEGFESLWSPIHADTPRPDARNVLLVPFEDDPDHSGFRFFLDANNDGQAGPLELGIVTAGDRTDIDFWVHRDVSNDVFMVPERAGTSVALYSTQPIDDLTSIDVAPVNGYATSGIQAVPGFGYVFQMNGGDGFARFGGVRVTHASQDYIIIDWSYQTDPGNPELEVHGGLPAYLGSGLVVKTGK